MISPNFRCFLIRKQNAENTVDTNANHYTQQGFPNNLQPNKLIMMNLNKHYIVGKN